MKIVKPQARQTIAQAEILFSLLFAATLGISGTGCSVHMWREGWAIHSTTMFSRKLAGYRRPVAVKNANGDIVFEYDVRLSRYGVTGTWGTVWGTVDYYGEILGLKRITNTISQRALQPITNIWLLIDAVPEKRIYPSTDSPNAFIQTGHNLPIGRLKMESDYSLRFPSSECVVWCKEYIWYVPPLHTNEVPMAAVLSRETIHTPVYLYPVKVVLFPICLVGDLFSAPFMFFDR
jgi:hypothetical protein